MKVKLGNVYYKEADWIKKYEVVRIVKDRLNDHEVVYLAHFDGSCSDLLYQWTGNEKFMFEFHNTWNEAHSSWTKKLKAEVLKRENFLIKIIKEDSEKLLNG